MQTHRLRVGGLMAAAVLGLSMAACDDSFSSISPEDRARAIRTLVQQGQGSGDRALRAGHDTRVAARVTDLTGQPVVGASVLWTTAQGSGTVAADSQRTDVDGVARGTWTLGTGAIVQEVVATVDGTQVLDRNDVVVFPDTIVGSITIVARDSIVKGDTTRVLVTEARDRYGNTYALNGTSADNPPPIVFASLDPSVATLVSTTQRSALISGVGVGTARILARTDGRADTTRIVVKP